MAQRNGNGPDRAVPDGGEAREMSAADNGAAAAAGAGTSAAPSPPPTPAHDWKSPEQLARLRRRHARNRRMKWLGLSAILLAAGMLLLLVVSLLATGLPAFTQTRVALDVKLDAKLVNPQDMRRGKWRRIIRNALLEALPPEYRKGSLKRKVQKIISRAAAFELRDHVMDNPRLIGRTIRYPLLASDPFDQYYKGIIPAWIGEGERRKFNPKLVNEKVLAAFERLKEEGRVSAPFNWALFLNPDSRYPEYAGLAGAIVGSFLTLLVCFVISFPVGIAAAIYLEEFAPRNRLTDLIEVNINNLAAVPSVVFGLLGLALFLGWFGLPRSAPLVGGMVLSLMTLPTIIIAARAALKAVPPSIREAALGIGASHHQMVLHHVLPVAMPGILTGAIIGMAQALGETAPLLLVGMNAFIPDISNMGLTEPATVLPTQIYSWADSPERGFVSRTAAAILVLLGFLLVMNAVAIWLRQRYSRKW